MENRVLVFMCRDVFGYYFANFVLLSLRVFSMRIFGFQTRSICTEVFLYLFKCFSVCSNAFRSNEVSSFFWLILILNGRLYEKTALYYLHCHFNRMRQRIFRGRVI